MIESCVCVREGTLLQTYYWRRINEKKEMFLLLLLMPSVRLFFIGEDPIKS